MAASAAEIVDTEGPKFGDTRGPKSMYIKLVSSDGHEFVIKREYALISRTIKSMLSGPGMCHYFSARHKL